MNQISLNNLAAIKLLLPAALIYVVCCGLGVLLKHLIFSSSFLGEVPYLPIILGPVVFLLNGESFLWLIFLSPPIIFFTWLGLLSGKKRLGYCLLTSLAWLLVGLIGWYRIMYSA
jgi:hypothetical protein